MVRKFRTPHLRRSIFSLQLLEDRSVPSSVQGTVFEDANHNQLLDPGESGLTGWTAYVDNNLDGILNPGEVSTITDVNGNYFIDTTSIPTNGGRHYVTLDLQVGSGGRWVNDTSTVMSVIPTSEPSAVRNLGVHFQPYVSVEPVGPESLMNITTAGSQFSPDVAADAACNYVSAWTTSDSGNPIVARVFNADGTPRTGELSISTNSNTLFHVAMADNGRFVVAWSSLQPAFGTLSVLARAYNADGTPDTGVITVAAATSKVSNWVGDVSTDAVGNFAVLYGSYKISGIQPEDHLVQRYTAGGATNGKSISVASTSIWLSARQSIAMDATGRFVVVWDQFSDNTHFVYAQKFLANGQKSGSQLTVATSSNPVQSWQSNVSMNGAGRFAVTWAVSNNALLMAQVYDWATPVGGNITLGSSASSVAAGVDVDAANNVTFAWAAADVNSNYATEIRFRRVSGGGTLEPESIVNTTTQGQQGDPPGNFQSIPVGVAATGNDRFVVAWQGNGSGDDAGVFAQQFALLTPAPPPFWGGSSGSNGNNGPTTVPTTAFGDWLSYLDSGDEMLP